MPKITEIELVNNVSEILILSALFYNLNMPKIAEVDCISNVSEILILSKAFVQ
jgi:hypothetical protein